MPRLRDVPRRELRLLLAAMALGLAVRVAYVLATRHIGYSGDEPEYDSEARFIAAGHWFWSTQPFGIAHASAWKAPGYPAWVGAWYAIAGPHPTLVRLAQTPLGPVTIALTWALARRLFCWRVALAAAFVVAVYPMAWQFEELLYPESFATPLSIAALLCVLGRGPSASRAALAGALLGLGLLVRPTAFFLLAGVAAALWMAAGIRRGSALTALTVGVALAVVAPWTIRNAVVLHGFVPISIQDAAAYGTFNREAATDPTFPWAWRPIPASDVDLFDRRHPVSDVAFRARANRRARSYVSHHPAALLEAFFWNGLSRTWDVRRPALALDEVRPEGSTHSVVAVGLGMYYLLLPLALIGLWRARRRREVVYPVLGLALGASLVFTVAASSRYRAPLEPLIATLACSTLVAARDRVRRGERRPSHEPWRS